MIIKSFEPISDINCKILILGTILGVKSLEKQQYYGHKQNHFWKIVYALFDKTVEEDYDKKKAFLLSHNIAVWDVLKSCRRQGSSDSKIINPVVNDFEAFFQKHTEIKAVYFNGSYAEQYFKKLVLRKAQISNNSYNTKITQTLHFYRLPSTSPANVMPFDEKLKQWKKILDHV